MDAHVASLEQLLKKPLASSDQKTKEFNQLKSNIKHYRVPETAIVTIFECIKLAITQQASSTLASTAFSTLGHLIKRLKIQDASGHAIVQLAPRLFPALHERLCDLREPVRTAASQALMDVYPFASSDVEHMIREQTIGSSNVRAKETGIRWVLRMHKEENMPFKAYVSPIVARLEDASADVREAAKSVLIELFTTAPERAKVDLKKQLKAHSVRHSIASQILAQIGAEGSGLSRPQTADRPEPSPGLTGSTRSLPTVDHIAHLADAINSEAAQPPPSETVPMDPIYIDSQREMDDTFHDMLPHFEGKETEQNWVPRDKSITKLRRIVKGNAPNEFHQAFMAGLKSMVEGIIKVSTSLRTTMASNGCQLVQELAKTLGPAMDHHVEMFLQTFIKMSAATKHIAAENGRMTADAIFQNCTYHVRMMQHIEMTLLEKNKQQRQSSPGWLGTILKRQSGYKQNFSNSGGLEIAERCIKKGLDDADPKVKERYRATYWTFAKSWPERAEAIISKLDPKARTALEKDSNNPNAHLHVSQTVTATKSRAAGTASRALKDRIAEGRKNAGALPSRPNSAMADLSPAKARPFATSGGSSSTRGPSNLSKVHNRNVSNASNTPAFPEASSSSGPAKKGSSLMSGPVRRPRRPEIQRPQTADPYASRRMLRPETPANETPAGSPGRGTGASKASLASSVAGRNASRAPGSPAGSPAKRSPVLTRARPQAETDSRPTSKGSVTTNGEMSVREDDMTLVMPKGAMTTARGGAFSPGHKRPGLGQTMSVDSGIPAMAGEDDGFTMVIPNFPNSSQPRTRSPLAYRSPMKAMFEDAREKVGKLSPEVEKHMRPTPEPEQNGGPVKAVTPQPEEVQVYEDPFMEDAAQPGAAEERPVLGELPINENVRLNSPTQSVTSSNSPAGSPCNQIDPQIPAISTPQDRSEAMRNKKLLLSGIERIRTKTLDAHGFRKIQDVVKSKSDIWEGGKKYDELMSNVLEYLQTFDQDPKLNQQPTKATGLKAQALGLVRALLTIHRKNALAWHAKALVTVLVCRKNIDPSSHILADLQRTADDIVQESSPQGCIDAVIDALPAPDQDAMLSIPMTLQTLGQFVSSSRSKGLDLKDQRDRLAGTVDRYLNDSEPEIRKVATDLGSELFTLFGPEEKAEFWKTFQGADEGRLGLLTYYIAKREQAV
ncbi:related to STU1 [Lecanosticta acicola]|uniref:Related to STU1 n=1 Tax=Lecanosticta acicola TaxID=111012 RepID=A0AAI8Z7L5_9PEZI|nr:related to STU1 [Lecanosticta acicola]